jgi:hypothetical protein
MVFLAGNIDASRGPLTGWPAFGNILATVSPPFLLQVATECNIDSKIYYGSSPVPHRPAPVGYTAHTGC